MIDNNEEVPNKTNDNVNGDSWNDSLRSVKKDMKSLWKFDDVDLRNLKYLVCFEAVCWALGVTNGSIYSALLAYEQKQAQRLGKDATAKEKIQIAIDEIVENNEFNLQTEQGRDFFGTELAK